MIPSFGDSPPVTILRCGVCGLPFPADPSLQLQPGSPLGPHEAPANLLQGDARKVCTQGVVDQFRDIHRPAALALCTCEMCRLTKMMRSERHQPDKGAFCPCSQCRGALSMKGRHF